MASEDATTTGSDASRAEDASPCIIDVAADPKNCGRCGHDCLGGTCADGQCRAVSVISNESPIIGIALDATNIYWARFDGKVRSSKLDGTGIRDIRQLSGVGHIEVDDTFIYAPGFATDTVSRFRKDGIGIVETLARCVGECLGIAIKDGRVYFSQRVSGGAGQVLVVESDGGATPLLAGLQFPEDLFATPTQLLIANEGGDSVLGLPYNSSTSTIVANVQDPVAVVVDATDLWIVSQNTKTIRRRPIAGGPIVIAADISATPVGIAQTATAIYWANDDGTIRRLAK